MNNLRRWMAIPPPLRWAIVVWIVLIAGVLFRVAFSGSTVQSVVPIYMLAGERWWHAEPLYAPPPGTMDVFRNPPGFAALFAPLSQLPIRPVALAWRALGVGLLLLGLRRFLAPCTRCPCRRAPRRPFGSPRPSSRCPPSTTANPDISPHLLGVEWRGG